MDEQKVSIFNAGVAQTNRIHQEQQIINMVKHNPLGMNDTFQQPNYEVWFSSINTLLQECSSKLKPEDLKEGTKRRKAIRIFMDSNQIFKNVTHNIWNKGVETKVDHRAWGILRDTLEDYELLVRGFLEKTGLNSPSQEEVGGWD